MRFHFSKFCSAVGLLCADSLSSIAQYIVSICTILGIPWAGALRRPHRHLHTVAPCASDQRIPQEKSAYGIYIISCYCMSPNKSNNQHRDPAAFFATAGPTTARLPVQQPSPRSERSWQVSNRSRAFVPVQCVTRSIFPSFVLLSALCVPIACLGLYDESIRSVQS